MRLRSPRLAVLALIATFALLLPATPATAATARPAQVGLVSFTAASLMSTGAKLTVDWADVAGATSYQVFLGRSMDSVAAATVPRATVTGSAATVTSLTAGVDYFVQVRAVNSAGPGPRSARVGHGTIAAQAAFPAGAPQYKTLTWNVCSNVCSGIAARTGTINSRIKELAPDVVALQEASKYTTAPSGYRFAVNAQNDLLVRTGQFSVVTRKTLAPAGSTTFARKSAAPGKGVAWAALQHRTGAKFIVFNVHMVSGSSAAQITQRESEAGQLSSFVNSTVSKMAASYGAAWKTAPVVILGDVNTHKSRSGDDTGALLKKAGWHDAYDQARALTLQHYNSANPTMSTKPVTSITWGDHVDKVLVRPSRSVVYSWANAGKRSGSLWASPLGSDHHPILVTLGVK